MNRRQLLSLLAALPLSGCNADRDRSEPPRPPGKLRLVFKHQPLWGDPAPFRELLSRFERAEEDVELVTEPLPNDSDVLHQYFLTALEAGTRDFDVFVTDVVWVPELARAGWIHDLSDAFPPAALRNEFLPGPAEAVILDGRTFAVPWYADVGILYYRTDLLPRAPETYDELLRFALDAMTARPSVAGYVWQGRQYEGLICNAYEAIWGHGGASMQGDQVLLDTPEARAGLSYLRSLVERGASPASVTSMAEEEARHAFQNGRAALMRNWPYAFAEAQREGSAVRDKVGLAPLPSRSGEAGSGALGGYQLALNARSPSWKRDAALRFLRYLTSLDANVTLAVAYGRNPPRRAAYDDPRLLSGAPFIARLRPMLERARPRPVTPYYPMIADTLAAELSAAITGVRAAGEALRRAQALVNHLTQGRP